MKTQLCVISTEGRNLYVQYLCKKQIPHFVRNDTFTTNLIVFGQALIRKQSKR